MWGFGGMTGPSKPGRASLVSMLLDENDGGVRTLEGTPQSAEQVDYELVDRAVEDLNSIYTSRALETACAIGRYVVEHFFHGAAVGFRRYGDKHASFRALGRHPGLRFAASYLWTAVAVLDQLTEMPDDIGRRLPLSHHRLLLPVKDRPLRLTLARRALDDGLSKRQLAREVQRARGGRDTLRDRESATEVAKAASLLLRASQEFVRAATSEDSGEKRRSSRSMQSLLERLEFNLDASRCAVEILRSRETSAGSWREAVSPGKHRQ